MTSVAEIREKFQTKASPPTPALPPPPVLSCLTARPWQPQSNRRKDAASSVSSAAVAKETPVTLQVCNTDVLASSRLRNITLPQNGDPSSDKTLSQVSTTTTCSVITTSLITTDKAEGSSPLPQVKSASPYATPVLNSKSKLSARGSPVPAAQNDKDSSLVSQMKNKFEVGTQNATAAVSPVVRCKPLLKPKPQLLSSLPLDCQEVQAKSDSESQLDENPSGAPEVASGPEPSATPQKLSEELVQIAEQVSSAWCRRPSNPPPPRPPSPPPKPPKPEALRSGAISPEFLDEPPPLPLKPSASFLHSTVSPPKRPPPLPPTEIKGKPLPPWPPEDSLHDGNDVEDLYDDGEFISSAGAEKFALKSDADDGNSSQTSGDYAEASLPTDSADQDEGIYEEMDPRYDHPPDEAKQRRIADKRLRREQKEQEKRKAKWRDKYNWSEDLRPVESGIAKRNVRGKNHDVGIREGETVRILRIDKNPPGKWLIQNEKGKIGYVDLTNIDVDPDSIRSVMFGPTYETLPTSYSPFSSNTQWVEEEEEDLYQDISNWNVPLPTPPHR